MIAEDFKYVAPKTMDEAIREFDRLTDHGMTVRYYAGGTEIITLARLRQLPTDAVIDIKQIEATKVIDIEQLGQGHLILGANLTLSQITDAPMMAAEFPLLQTTVNEIADKTARNKITLGGNLCGHIFYREAVLPLLVCDSKLRIVGPDGRREISIHQVFHKEMNLQPGEFIVQTMTNRLARHAPFLHIKRRKMGQVGYPIVTAAAIQLNERIRIALSGVCPFPFRSSAIEAVLNRKNVNVQERIKQAIQIIPEDLILDDYEASRSYRIFVLETVLTEILNKLGDG